MKCFALQTTSNAASASHSSTEQTQPSELELQRLRRVATEFEGMLFSIALRPVASSLGPLSDVVTNGLACQVAEHVSQPLYERLREQIG